MDVRLPAPGRDRPWLPLVALVVGVILLVAPAAAIATQGLDALDRLDALMLSGAGLVIAGWGGYGLAGPRARLSHATDVHLDGIGVTVRGADVAAMLTWPNVSAVEVQWWEIVPPYVDEARHLPVLRFVADHDQDISVQGTHGISADLAQAFGSTPAAAAMAVVVGAEAVDPLQQLLTWVQSNRPDVPLLVEAAPEL